MMRARRKQRGFTLLELLVAFAIMALALGMLYRAAGASARSVGDIERYQRAVVLAESLLALRDAVPEEGWAQSGESAGYRWTITSAPYPVLAGGPNAPQLHEIIISIGWLDGGRSRQFSLNTLRPQMKPLPGQGLQ